MTPADIVAVMHTTLVLDSSQLIAQRGQDIEGRVQSPTERVLEMGACITSGVMLVYIQRPISLRLDEQNGDMACP
jgi:hypothetical protein